MFWAILIALAVVALLMGGVVSGVLHLLFAPHREPNSPTENAVLGGLGAAAFLAMVITTAVAPQGWWLPPALWLVVLSVMRHSAPLKETPAQRQAREEAELKQARQDERRAAARKAVAERARVDSYTKAGLALLDRARSAVEDVRATEAARDGWLGEVADLDFGADLDHISDALLQARRIEKVVERTKKIPDPSPDDVAQLRDAEKAVKKLRAEAKNRAVILDGCLKQAREIDRLLADERRRQQIDEQRQAARRQLAAELFIDEVRPAARDSHTADAIAARVQAFKELKHIVDEATLREIEGTGTNPLHGALIRVRRTLPF